MTEVLFRDRRNSRKYPAVMTPRISTKTGHFSVFLLSRLFTLLSASLRHSRSLPLGPPLWCLRLIVLKGVEVMQVLCWQWIADGDDKASLSSCPLTSPASTLTPFITLNIIILWKESKGRDETGGKGMWSENNRRKKIKNNKALCSPVCVKNVRCYVAQLGVIDYSALFEFQPPAY